MSSSILAQTAPPAEPPAGDGGSVLDAVGEVSVPTEGLADLVRPYVPESLQFLVDNLISPGLTILVIVVLAAVLARVAKRAISHAVQRMKQPADATAGSRLRSRLTGEDREEDLRRVQRAEALGSVARSVAAVVIWSLAIIMILGQVNIQIGPLIAGAGIVGVALGFGAQDLVKDFLSGVFMLIEDQYGVGDVIDAGEATGVVEAITLRSTRLRGIDGTLWHIPNGEIRRVGNMSQDFTAAVLDVGVSYDTDIDVASELISRVAHDMATEEQYRDIFLDEPELLGVENLGADAVDIRLKIKVQPAQHWGISRELRRRIKKAFDAAGIEIPFAQRTVWLRTEAPVALGGADAPAFAAPTPDEATLQRAVELSRRGDTGAPDEVTALREETAAAHPDRDRDRP